MYMRQDNYLAFFAAFLAFLSTVATFLIALPGFEAPFAIPTLSGHYCPNNIIIILMV